jgi:membrane protease YdiL (CAAX protease family)
MLSMAHAGAWQGVIHSPAAWIFTSVLVIVFPIVDYLLYFHLKSTVGLYVWNILAEWSLVAGCVRVIHRNGLRVLDLGEWLGNPLRNLVVAGLLVVIIAALVVFKKGGSQKASAEQLSRAASKVRRLLPITRTERAIWVAVALTAGVCEEILYRGWLLNLFGNALGSVWVGLVISSIVFGAAHAYQGRNGIIGTGVLGIVFGGVFVLSGALLLGQILHAGIDLQNGFALGKMVGRLEDTP